MRVDLAGPRPQALAITSKDGHIASSCNGKKAIISKKAIRCGDCVHLLWPWVCPQIIHETTRQPSGRASGMAGRTHDLRRTGTARRCFWWERVRGRREQRGGAGDAGDKLPELLLGEDLASGGMPRQPRRRLGAAASADLETMATAGASTTATAARAVTGLVTTAPAAAGAATMVAAGRGSRGGLGDRSYTIGVGGRASAASTIARAGEACSIWCRGRWSGAGDRGGERR